jgi:hypothetical protein
VVVGIQHHLLECSGKQAVSKLRAMNFDVVEQGINNVYFPWLDGHLCTLE